MGYNSKEIKVENAKVPRKPKDIIYDPKGQYKYPGKITKIPGGDITMKGITYPILGVDNLGNSILMMPGEDYKFPGTNVTEYPILQSGGSSPISVDKARAFLESGSIYGHSLTQRQEDYFKEVAGVDYNEDGELVEVGEPLEEIEDEDTLHPEFKQGGWLKKYNKLSNKRHTSKNIQSSINYLFRRNEELFGPRGRRLYKPKLEDGGWLDKYNNFVK